MDAAPSALTPLFALVDCNNFYVSCERVFQPWLRGKPVVVLSNNDGCIISRSQEAKALGVRMGAPWHEARALTETHGLIGLSSNYALYGDLSRRVMAILGEMAPRQEVYSIDETFLDLTGVPSPECLAQAMRERVLQWTHIPTCVGLGRTKTLAKLANHVAKTRPENGGICNLESLEAGEREALFAAIPVGEVWGVGRRLQEALSASGIRTVADLARADPDRLRTRFSVVLARTVLELRGLSCLSLEEVADPQKQLIHSRSFGHLVIERADLEEAVRTFTLAAAAKLRQRGLQTSMLQVFVRTNPFRPQDPQYNNTIAMPLAAPTQDSRILTALSREGLARIFRPGYRYKKAGVMLTALGDARLQQFDWLHPGDAEESRTLMAVVDRINRHMGRNTVQWGLNGRTAQWGMRRDQRSPRFTSRWEELAPVRS